MKKVKVRLTQRPMKPIFNQVVEYPMTALNRVFFALSDPTRRAILLRVADGELTVTALAAPFAISLAAVSKHIRVLEEAGLVERRKQGREHRLRFVATPLREAADWVKHFDRFWTDHLQRIKELAEQKARNKETKP
jgi:DNA-binding transcriptional ArsR family regulator